MIFSSSIALRRLRGRTILAAPLLALAVSACFSADHRLYELRLTGEIDVAPGFPAAGRVHVEVHHQSRGDGPLLERPLGLIDAFELPALGPVDHLVTVPIDEGEGLVVYAWLDLDGDGLLCAPGAAPEPSAAVEFPDQEFLNEGAHQLDFALTLSAPCVGPERALDAS